MTQGKKLGIFVITALVLIGGGFYYFYKRNLKRLEGIILKVKGAKIKGNFKTLTARGNIEITNPSELKVEIEKYSINVSIEGVLIGTLANNKANMLIAPNSILVFPYQLSVDVAKFSANLLSLVMAIFVERNSTQPIKIRYQGTISGKHGVISFNDFPVDYTYEYDPSKE
jgi:LEA14-like dessication related protein